ncbi:MAG: CAP domain-containing protein [Solirubrobacteraceae bacterium]
MTLPATAAAACRGAGTPLSSLDGATARTTVLCAVNAQRAARGLAAYTDSAGLDAAAQGYSGAMVAQAFFDHLSPGGSTLVDRVRAAGWLPGAGTYGIGEAIAWAGAPIDTATYVVGQWLNSPPHRAILLDPGYREAGVGVARGVPDGSGAPGSTLVLDAGVRKAAARSAGTESTAQAPASKVRPWRSRTRCARAARRSPRMRARCASASTRSKHATRVRRPRSTRSAITWKGRLTVSRPTF